MSPSSTFFRLLKYFIKYKWRIVAGLLSVAIMSLTDTASAYLIARLFEILQTISQQVRLGQEILVDIPIKFLNKLLYSFTIHGQQESFELIYKFAFAVIVIILIKVTFVYVREYLMSSVQQKIMMRFRIELFDRIVLLPIKYFDENKTGYIMSRITNDVNNIEQSITLIVEMAQNFVYSFVYAAALFYTNWKLAIVTILIFALSGEISRKFGDKIRSYSHALTNTLAEISSFIQERITAIRIVKSFTREEKEKKSFKQKAEANYHYSMKIVRVTALLSPTNELFNTTAASLLVIFCGYLFIKGSMSIETMLFFLILMINLAKPVKALGESAARIQKTLVSAGYIFEILDHPVESNKKDAPSISISHGNVEYRNVSFSYNNDLQALKEINVQIRGGEKIALVGPSGGGKSTFINMIPRFYEAQQGNIFIDGMNIQDVDLYSLRSQIAIVPQDVILFSGTVFTNIQYGRLDAPREEVLQAARDANAHDFIEKLEKGYETEVGERGLQLSGGQRQRIAIARAILRNPRILLLDEATSALDTESELMVKEALERLMEGRTSFIIAHRLSTIAHCDRIIVIDSGRIVESGTHDELLSKNTGLYRRLHELQFDENPA
ncbi:MAG: ATP-binding cassette domain-containing protein [Ignavibacteriae bacterium]|nr:MAG: ATP-binding cassette domain-containing protein [Ignavibacteriota bacterium]